MANRVQNRKTFPNSRKLRLMKKISIIIPVYNEKNTIREIIKHVESAPICNLEKEIIIIDDCSTDGTKNILKSLSVKHNKIIFHDKNRGKGAALRSGFQYVTGDIVIIQDADLEYDPNDYEILIKPILVGKADVVYGSRILSVAPHRVLFFWHYLGNRFLTFLSNILTNLTLTDMETGYKAFTKDVLEKILPKIKSKWFGIEPELTALFAQNKFRIYEVGISYSGRTYEEGKKINWRDGLAAIWHIIRFNLFN